MIIKKRKRLRSTKEECPEIVSDSESLECVDGTDFSEDAKIFPEDDTVEVHGHGPDGEDFEIDCELVVHRGEKIKCRRGQVAYRWNDIPSECVYKINDH